MRNTSKRDIVLQELKVTQSGELLDFLISKQVRKSRNAIKSLLAHKQIKVNNRLVTQYNQELKAGDTVFIMKYDQSRKEKRLKGLKIVFEDDDIIVIDKEAGFLSVSTDKEKINTIYGTLNEYVKNKNKNDKIFVLHRLDKGISGLMVFAKDMELQTVFQKNWDQLVKEYTYSAIVEGCPPNKKGAITSWLTENKNLVMVSSPTDNGGLHAVTHYKTVKTTGRYSLLDIRLETRRKNQIRAHMQYIGHPVVGDKKYGASNNPIKRIALHGASLTLKHPSTGELLEFRSNIPKSMQLLISDQKPNK